MVRQQTWCQRLVTQGCACTAWSPTVSTVTSTYRGELGLFYITAVFLLASVLQLTTIAPAFAVSFTDTVITGESSILNTGTLLEANNLGASPASTTINGILFGIDQSKVSGGQNGSGDFSTSSPAVVRSTLS